MFCYFQSDVTLEFEIHTIEGFFDDLNHPVNLLDSDHADPLGVAGPGLGLGNTPCQDQALTPLLSLCDLIPEMVLGRVLHGAAVQ